MNNDDDAALKERIWGAEGRLPKIMLATFAPKPFDGLPPCFDGLGMPGPAMLKTYAFVGDGDIGSMRNACARTCIELGYDYLFMIDDDTFAPESALVNLFDQVRDNEKWIVGAHYNKKIDGLRKPIGASIELTGLGVARPIPEDGELHDAWVLATGCICIPVQAFRDIGGEDWFTISGHLNDDVRFSQLAREAGYRVLCDASIHCRHVDRVTKIEY